MDILGQTFLQTNGMTTMMKRMKLWVMSAIVCSAMVLTACTSNEDNGGTKDDGHAKKALLIVLDGWGIGDHAINPDGTPNTAHSTNPVPFIYVTADKNAMVRSGILADVAPSVLHIMGLQQPQEMTGQCLISDN